MPNERLWGAVVVAMMVVSRPPCVVLGLSVAAAGVVLKMCWPALAAMMLPQKIWACTPHDGGHVKEVFSAPYYTHTHTHTHTGVGEETHSWPNPNMQRGGNSPAVRRRARRRPPGGAVGVMALSSCADRVTKGLSCHQRAHTRNDTVSCRPNRSRHATPR